MLTLTPAVLEQLKARALQVLNLRFLPHVFQPHKTEKRRVIAAEAFFQVPTVSSGVLVVRRNKFSKQKTVRVTRTHAQVEVLGRSPAEAAGIKAGDVLVR